MDTIIGFGKAGCALADKCAQYSQYSVYKIDDFTEIKISDFTSDALIVAPSRYPGGDVMVWWREVNKALLPVLEYKALYPKALLP